ncbi:MAG: shikimate dehydrogenase [Betaproteobacteria bacterium AqS2]|uniref:Shikimate dehydrogenase (NADP(+)) n=1 Tax=Candidatus Amphirhobacter heronislandensis TaxID=1732024 RepID=A0A930XXL7_9GAMM|nr:shikimate dehydrogenase [Betaproteobacteria bacterium AqS2]
MSAAPQRFAVVGRPVAHSMSPAMHAMFAAETGFAIEYGKIEPAADESFESCAKRFFAAGGTGLNVTLPYKAEALAFADSASRLARLAGAANTLKAEEDGGVSACNTDGAGLVTDLRTRHGIELAGLRLLLLGAGGASAGVLPSLLQAKPKAITIANRTAAKAAELAGRFAAFAKEHGVELASCGLEETAAGGWDLVVNATAAGRGAAGLALPAAAFGGARLAYDMSYRSADDSFLMQAAEAGVERRCDGLGMLVEQGALSFAYWLGAMPATEPAYARLRAEIDGE